MTDVKEITANHKVKKISNEELAKDGYHDQTPVALVRLNDEFDDIIVSELKPITLRDNPTSFIYDRTLCIRQQLFTRDKILDLTRFPSDVDVDPAYAFQLFATEDKIEAAKTHLFESYAKYVAERIRDLSAEIENEKQRLNTLLDRGIIVIEHSLASDDSCQMQLYCKGHVDEDAFRKACEAYMLKYDERTIIADGDIKQTYWGERPADEDESLVCDHIFEECDEDSGYPVTLLETWLPLHHN